MSVHIAQTSTALPQHKRTTEEIIPYVEQWLANEDERFRRKAIKIFRNAAIDQRYGIMPVEDVFTQTSFEEKNRIYAAEARKLGKKVITEALEKANWKAESLDYIISVSCTGIMIPSVDAYLINDLKLRQDIVRLPITEMGCVAGVSALIYAYQFLTAHPNKRAAILAIEAPTATFQHTDLSMTNIVSAAIFGDGAACVLLSSEENEADVLKPVVRDGAMYHFFDAAHMMGFDLTNNGLKMILDPSVPETIQEHFPAIINPFLEKNGLDIPAVDHLIFHPGGKKIVQTVEELFGVLGKNIDDTKAVLSQCGNMSSATVLYVLHRFMHKELHTGDIGLMLSFGPGFTAQRVLLEWQ